jgi:hypothetical protein
MTTRDDFTAERTQEMLAAGRPRSETCGMDDTKVAEGLIGDRLCRDCITHPADACCRYAPRLFDAGVIIYAGPGPRSLILEP